MCELAEKKHPHYLTVLGIKIIPNRVRISNKHLFILNNEGGSGEPPWYLSHGLVKDRRFSHLECHR